MTYTRRDLGRIAMAALPAGKLLAAPDSKFGGVQIGIIISAVLFRDMPLAAGDVLKNVVELGINAIELQDIRVEADAGAPVVKRTEAPANQEARRKAAAELNDWRLSASLDKYKRLGRMYRDAGVNIYAFRVAALGSEMPDELLAYYFNTAEALGATQITGELPAKAELTARLGAYAEKRRMMIGYHNHTQVNFNSWDTALAQSKYNAMNFDVGHFGTAVNQSPIPFLEKHHERIVSLHLKDRKFATHGGQNVPWGQGDTSLKEILAVMKRRKYTFPAAIEMEYPIPEGSTTMAELGKCLRFCKEALT